MIANHSSILLIDDNATWLESLADYLRSRGLPVLTTSDPLKGLELLADRAASIVVCDFNMPVMDGLQILRHLRSRGDKVAVLLLTSEEAPDLEQLALAEGAGGFFRKNASPMPLLRQLLQTLAALAADEEHRGPLEPWQRLLPSPFGSGMKLLGRSLPAPPRRARSA